MKVLAIIFAKINVDCIQNSPKEMDRSKQRIFEMLIFIDSVL